MKLRNFLFYFLLMCTMQLSAAEDTLKASVQAANDWLKLIDNEKYEESWSAGSVTFKLTVPKKNWVTLMSSLRKPFGNVSSRKVVEQRTAKDPSGLPKGDYMVLFYETSFAHKGTAHELVTLVQESDGKWKVLTYQVQ